MQEWSHEKFHLSTSTNKRDGKIEVAINDCGKMQPPRWNIVDVTITGSNARLVNMYGAKQHGVTVLEHSPPRPSKG